LLLKTLSYYCHFSLLDLTSFHTHRRLEFGINKARAYILWRKLTATAERKQSSKTTDELLIG